MLVFLLWTLNVVLDTGGQLAFKMAATVRSDAQGTRYWLHLARQPWVWVGLACYVGEFVAWLAFLSLVPLSEGVLLGSINIVAIMLAGRFLFNETLTWLRLAGMILIAAGVAVVGLR